MKKIIMTLAALSAILTPSITMAEETSEQMVANKATLKANIKRIALEYMEHSASNKNDPNYPDSYNSDEQSTIGGLFDGNITYETTDKVWVNGLFANYSKSETTEDNVKTENENTDEILLFTDYTQKIWQLEDGVVGPFGYLGYETEFTTFDLNNESYRTKILRAKVGLKLYDGKYFKQLYLAVIEEDDMTYNSDNMKTGSEIGYEFNYPINENTSLVSDGYYRHFFSYSEKEPTDFEYKLAFNNRIETKLTGDLYLAPFYNYELAETRGASKSRSQSTFGLSLSYNKSFDL